MKYRYAIYTNDAKGVHYYGESFRFEEACRMADGIGGFVLDLQTGQVLHDGQFA